MQGDVSRPPVRSGGTDPVLEEVGTKWLEEAAMIWPSQDAGGLRSQASPGHPPNSSRPGPSTAPGWTAARGGGGTRRLNHLSLCSPQLNGSGQLKMSSHCLSAQMLAPPPPGLPRLALPPATKPTSEGGSSSPTSPCKHPGRRPQGPLPSPAPLLGSGA